MAVLASARSAAQAPEAEQDRFAPTGHPYAEADQRLACVIAEAMLQKQPDSPQAWRLLATAREQSGDLIGALEAYEAALRRAPDQACLLIDLARLALRMGLATIAEGFSRTRLAADPRCPEAVDALARALRDQRRYAEAIELLRGFITASPEYPAIWNTLGTVLNAQGDSATALTFFDEALRLDPEFGQARYNRAGAKADLGDLGAALRDCEAAIEGAESPVELAVMRFARATMLLCVGELGQGWAAYETRLAPEFPGRVQFDIEAPRWRPDQPLDADGLLVVAEQGVGDEIMFANVVPDLLQTSSAGTLRLAVEPRLVTLFQRSFPETTVTAHLTRKDVLGGVRSVPELESTGGRGSAVKMWAPLGSLMGRLRPTVESFPGHSGYLTPCPARVEHWRQALEDAPGGRKVGVTWRSGSLGGERGRGYAPLALWRDVLSVRRVSFIDIQYGEHEAERAYAREVLGVDLWRPPGLDVTHELDELAALCCALDLVAGCANATTNLAAACGAPVWMICPPSAWPGLGTSAYPWYPQVRVFRAPSFNDWEPALEQAASALAASS